MTNPTQVYEVRRPYRVRGYVVVGWGVPADVDDPNLFEKVRAYTSWVAGYRSVMLMPLLAEGLKGDEAVLPASLSMGVFWRLRALWLNFWRFRANRREAKRQAAYYSAAAVHARRMASQ